MRKIKAVERYVFNNLSHKEMIDLLNKKIPINMKENEDLINRIYIRYPLIDKTQISVIVKLFFQSIRDFLILGKIMNFNNLFFDTKLLMFLHRRNKVIFPAIKIRISTPPILKKYK